MTYATVYSELTTKSDSLHNYFIKPIFAEVGLEEPLVRNTKDDLEDIDILICFGQKVFEKVTGQTVTNFYNERGTSAWLREGSQRVILTYTPDYVGINPNAFIDFVSDLTIPCKYPIPKEPTVVTQNTVIDADLVKLRQVYETLGSGKYPHPTIDVETTGFNAERDSLLCISIGLTENRSVVLTPGSWKTYPNIVKRILLTTNQWVGHNIKFDAHFLRKLEPDFDYAHDTLLMHYVLDERLGVHGLKYLASTRLALPDYEAELREHLKRKGDSYDTIPTDVLYRYAGQDACYTLRLFKQLQEEIVDDERRVHIEHAYEFLIEAQKALGEIEDHGFIIDQDSLDELEIYLYQMLEELVEQLQEIVPGINPRSPKQVAAYLYDTMGYREVKLFRNHKPRSTAHEALVKLSEIYPDDPFIQLLLTYRDGQKIYSTYVQPIRAAVDPDGRLRTDFKLHGTVTGRLSSSKPNLQNVPRPTKNEAAQRIRNLFIVEEGNVMVGADYSQAELRIAAMFAREEGMKEIWESGRDLHTETCIDLFGQNFTHEDRMIAKMLNFGVVYGRTASSISVERGISMAEANGLMNRFFAAKPKLYNWLQKTRRQAVDDGFLVTPLGRVRRFGLITPDNEWRIQNQAANFLIQSTASDCCLRAAIDMHNWCKEHGMGKVLLLVHDSIYVECKREDAERVQGQLEHLMRAAALKVLDDDWIPMAVESLVAQKWGQL